MLHSELQNVCEISYGLGKLQQEHKENPSAQDSLLRLRYLKLFKTQHNGRHSSKTDPCATHTWIHLAGLFRLIQHTTANRDIKRTQLPPEKSARFLSALFQTKHLGKATHSLAICWMIRKGQWVDQWELFLTASKNVHVS